MFAVCVGVSAVTLRCWLFFCARWPALFFFVPFQPWYVAGDGVTVVKTPAARVLRRASVLDNARQRSVDGFGGALARGGKAVFVLPHECEHDEGGVQKAQIQTVLLVFRGDCCAGLCRDVRCTGVAGVS